MGYVLIVRIKGKRVGQKSLGASTSPVSIARAKREWKDDHKYEYRKGTRCSYEIVYKQSELTI
jgi:hypothetical protein